MKGLLLKKKLGNKGRSELENKKTKKGQGVSCTREGGQYRNLSLLKREGASKKANVREKVYRRERKPRKFRKISEGRSGELVSGRDTRTAS